MKPFNLDEAMAGALFCGPSFCGPSFCGPSGLTYKYVGQMSDGRIACERSDGILACRTADEMRMVPPPLVRVVRYVSAHGLFKTGYASIGGLSALRDRTHATEREAEVCGGCDNSGYSRQQNPILRIEWQE